MSGSRSFVAGFERRLHASLPGGGPDRGDTVIVAVSGGADSSAALLAFQALIAAGRLEATVCACYVDHGLRAEAERAAEVALLRDACERIGVDLEVRAVDLPGARRVQRLSVEATARRLRYDALGAVAAARGAAAVVTGHTADDQVETVLLRLLRGTGVRGLRGMGAATRFWGDAGPRLLRPLLGTTHEETQRYCAERGFAWAHDSSNDSPRFRRNRLRNELLPLMREIAPGGPAALLRLAGQAAALEEWLDAETQRLLPAVWRADGCGWLLVRPAPAAAPALLAEIVRAALIALVGPPGPPSERHVTATVDLWLGRRGRSLAIGHGWQAEAGDAGVRFRRRAPADPLTEGRAPGSVAG